MTRKRRRLYLLLLCALGLGSATALTLTAFQDNLVFFRSPSDIARDAPAPDRAFRLGGLVETGSVERATVEGRPIARFRVTDGGATIPVAYGGVLPDLFREGQGVVTLGRLGPDGIFQASEVLARHDETYMPPEVADALKRAGHWNPAEGAPPPAASWNTLDPARVPAAAGPAGPSQPSGLGAPLPPGTADPAGAVDLARQSGAAGALPPASPAQQSGTAEPQPAQDRSGG